LMRYFPSSLIIGVCNNNIVLEDFLNSQPKNWIKFLNPADFCYHASVLPVSDLKKIVLPTDPVEKICIAMANNFQKEESFTWFEKFYKTNKENIWIGIEKSELFAADVKNNFRMLFLILLIFSFFLFAMGFGQGNLLSDKLDSNFIKNGKSFSSTLFS